MRSILASLLIAVTLAFAPRGQAGTHTWTGGSTDGRWSVGANWVGGSPPVANESPLHLVFPSSATRRLATNNIANITIDSIAFGGAAYTLAATGAGTNVTFNSSVGHLYWNILATNGTAHTFHYSMNLALNGTMEFNIETNNTVTLRSRLSAASPESGLRKDGPGIVRLDPIADNTFDGTTTIVNGTLRLEGSHVTIGGFTVPNVTVPGPLVIGANSLAQQPVCLVWQANQIADTSPVTVNRNGKLLLADVNDTIGPLTMFGGIVDTANGKLTLNGNVLVQDPPSGTVSQIHGYLDLGTFGRFFTVETNAEFYVGAIISGGAFGNAPAGVHKLGPGWMALTSPSNTFGGDLYISAGTVSITNGKQIGAPTNAASVANGGTLALSGIGNGPIVDDKKLNLQTGARLLALLDSEWNGPVHLYGQAIIEVGTGDTLEIGGVISGSGGFTKAGEGELILSGWEDNSFTGVTLVDDGLLSLSKIGLFTNAIAVSGPLTVGGDDDTKTPRVHLTQFEEIAPTVPIVVNQNAELLLLDHNQTMGSLAVNGGYVDSGTFGAVKLAGNIASTNSPAHYAAIHGRLELGNAPRSIYVFGGNGIGLSVHAVISGGPAASLTKTGENNLELYAANTYQGLTVISEGTIHMHHPVGLGSSAAGTMVANGASLFLNSDVSGQLEMTVAGEPLTLSGGGYAGVVGALRSYGTNVWDGVITLQNSVIMHTHTPTDRLILPRSVQGPGGLTKTGPGKLFMAGFSIFPADNTYSGATIVKDGELALAKDNFLGQDVALAGDLSIQPSGPGAFPSVRVQGRQQFLGTNAVTIYPGGWLRIDSPSIYNSIGSLAGNGVVEFAPGTRLVTGLNNQNTTFAGTLQGGGPNDTNLVKYGAGILTLTGANSLASRVHVGGGTLRVDSTQPIARYDVTTPGYLGGIGSVNTVRMRGGYLAPGSPLGKLHANTFTVMASHWMHIDIHGPALGTGFDQFEVNAAPDLNFTTLGTALGNGFNPSYGQEFLILRNNSGSPVIGHFMGLDEGASFLVDNTHRMQITYLGGDGNDVVLKTVAGAGEIKGITTDGNRVYINGSGTPGATYTVQATTTVENPASWVDLGDVIAGPDGLMQYVDADMANYPHRFFRFSAP